MRNLALVKILELVSRHIRSVCRCSGSRCILFFVDNHATHGTRIMALALRLLDCNVAGVRAQECVRLFTFFDALFLHKQVRKGENRQQDNPPYLTPIIG